MTIRAQMWKQAQAGFTLTEVMVATMMTTALLAAGFGALTVSQKGARVSGQVGNTQATARNALDMITADLKLAGFGMQGLTTPVGGCHINGTPSALVPVDNSPAGADFGPDSISMVVPMTNSITAVGALWQVFVPPAGTIGGPKVPIANIPMPANATTGMGNAIPGGTLALPGNVVSLGGVAGSIIQAANVGGLTINPAIQDPTAFGTGTQVYLVQCITYQVIPPPDALNLCQGASPCLVRGAVPAALVLPGTPPNCNQLNANCVPIMDGVEDLQLEYACDGCSPIINSGNLDGQIDDLNGNNIFDIPDFVTNRNWFGTAAPFGASMSPVKIRMAQVSIVARQTQLDQGLGEGISTTVSNSNGITNVSDHNHATGVFAFGDNTTPAQQQAYLQFRRRVQTRTVELRNMRAYP
ncbi:MAG: PilW family protein [Nitrospirota bacterium]